MDELSDQIGEQLQKAREKAGLAVDDVAFQTRIPHTAIEALESEDFSYFISPVYAKSFLSQYSSFLNVEAGPWLDALKPSAFIDGDPLIPLLGGFGQPSVEAPRHGEPRGGWISMLWLLVVSCGVVFAAMKAFEFFERQFGVEAVPQANEQNRNYSPQPEKPAAEKSQRSLEVVPLPEKKEEDPFNPPPRAIIVR